MFSLFESTAYAAGGQPGMLEQLGVPFAIMFIIMYFLMIRPQQKKMKDHQDLLTNLKAGEEIITSGGIIGKVKNVSESFVTLETGPNSTMKVIKENISSLTKGKTDKTKSDKTKS